MNRPPLRLAGLFSGGGTTLEKVFRATQEGGILHGKVEIPVIIGSNPNASGFERLKKSDFSGMALPCQVRGQELEEYLLGVFDAFRIDVFGQYGWIPQTPKEVIANYLGINQHPALTPHFGGKGFYGLAPHAAALYFACLTGIWTTYPVAQRVHIEYDKGEILATTPVQIQENDTAESLQRRVLPYEWLTQITALLRIWDAGGQNPAPIPTPLCEFTEQELFYLKEVRAQVLNEYRHQ